MMPESRSHFGSLIEWNQLQNQQYIYFSLYFLIFHKSEKRSRLTCRMYMCREEAFTRDPISQVSTPIDSNSL
jgi:hypothetical protein